MIDRLNEALQGRYLIERELGEGGMAFVYLADDLKHDRKVALKVLKPELAQMLGKERFLAEIRTTANLQHPNILPLFDSGEADGFLFYVMPFVEGETLRDRLKREVQLPVDQSLDLIRKVASALEYAHGKNIVHRDLKPANILLSSGEPLVADFGIALAVQHAGEGRMTQTGLSMGTPQYMSPEQASGDRSLDPRSDIYALGCVLYEMLSGDPPFSGSNAQAVLARILTTLPSRVTVQRPTVPPHVDAVIARTLEKIPADRFTTAADFRKALDDPGFRHSTVAHIEPGEQPKMVVRRKNPALIVGLAAVAAVAVIVAVLGWARSEPAPPVQKFLVELSTYNANGPDFAVSPDGSRIVYVGNDGQLYLRPVSSLESTPLAGTQGARGPFFSPSGTSIGFNAGSPDRIFTLSLSGGSPVPIGDVGDNVNVQATWAEDGYVYYQRDGGETGIVRARAQGGPAEVVMLAPSGASLSNPSAIPGRTDAILVHLSGAGVQLLDVEAGSLAPIPGLEQAESAHVIGDLVVWRSVDNLVIAAPFDVGAAVPKGPPVTLARGVSVQDFAVSQAGTLVYRSGERALGSANRGLVARVALDGTVTVGDSLPVMDGMDLNEVSLSPDGRYLAIGANETGTANADQQILIYDLEQKTSYRLTQDGNNVAPRWLADGRVAYVHAPGIGANYTEIRARPFDRSGPEEVLLAGSTEVYGFDAAPDPDLPMIVSLGAQAGEGEGFWVFRPGDDPSDPDLTPFLVSPSRNRGVVISPDGRWVAYHTNESGVREVQVRAFPEGRRPWPISDGVGRAPAWGPDPEVLFYDTPQGMMRRELEIGDGVRIGSVTNLGEGSIVTMESEWRAYDVTPDGSLIGILRTGTVNQQSSYAVVVLNLFAEVQARLSELPR